MENVLNVIIGILFIVAGVNVIWLSATATPILIGALMVGLGVAFIAIAFDKKNVNKC